MAPTNELNYLVQEDRMVSVAHGLVFEIQGCAAEVFLNDVPVTSTSADLRRAGTIPLTHWIVDGVNTLALRISAVRSVDNRALPDARCRAAIEIVEGEAGQIPRPGEVRSLAAMTWVPETSRQGELPTVLSMQFHLVHRPRWAWQDARVVDPSNSLERRRVLSFVRYLHSALSTKQIDVFLDAARSLVAEAGFLGATPTDARTSLAASFWTLASLVDYQVGSYSDEQVVLRSVADGRAMIPLSQDLTPILKAGPLSAEHWRLPIVIAEIHGSLEVVHIG